MKGVVFWLTKEMPRLGVFVGIVGIIVGIVLFVAIVESSQVYDPGPSRMDVFWVIFGNVAYIILIGKSGRRLGERPSWHSWTSFIGVSLIAIVYHVFGFGALYADAGIIYTSDVEGFVAPGSSVTTMSDVPPRIYGFLEALYLSAISLTTVGYGDFRPAPHARGIASMQAIIGYVLLGILISSMASGFSARSTANGQEELTGQSSGPSRAQNKSLQKGDEKSGLEKAISEIISRS